MPSSPEARPQFRPGQRWISIAEPELGLGVVRQVAARSVTVFFPATSDTRQYVNSPDAPLRRAAFRVGDTIATQDGASLQVDEVRESDGVLAYRCGSRNVHETALSHTLSFSSPTERLFAGQFDASHVFQLRAEALAHQAARRQSRVRGFVGGRIDLLPHQLGIAAEVTGRLVPRVLLADEVGLGKTIEACLILHRLLHTGRAERVLVVVPETLVHQWFLELLRRFNLWFHIFTEARCVAIEEADPGANPFLDDQLLLCELPLFTGNEVRLAQALEAGWDVVVVDEAHHLRWTPGEASPEYEAIEQLGRVSPGLLLLTATPEQLGMEGHFARLRLLDPDRFHDLELFRQEMAGYADIARLADRLDDGSPLEQADVTALARLLDQPGHAIAAAAAADDAPVRRAWIDQLLDRHGTGRVMFRNTRAAVAGFPSRRAHLHALDATTAARRDALAREWTADLRVGSDGADDDGWADARSLAHDPRVGWLLDLLQAVAPEKVLLLCRTERKALALEAALRHRTTIPLAAFHEGLTLVQRDRGAAWFADPEGARLLVCSEIGSEGRNFQFAHHLVLFDLPLDPGLLEQRIGRLDRIGQREQIHIHIPFVRGSHLEVLARWYHEGLDAVERHLPGARELLQRFEPELRAFAGDHRPRTGHEERFDTFIERVREARREVAHRMEIGRDRLLERNSLRPALSSSVIDEIVRQDEDRTLDRFMLAVFDLFFVQVEETAPRTYRLGSAGVLVDDFPGLKADGLICTRDRHSALRREDLQFLTWDHPLASGALDMLLGSERGNCGFGRWPDPAVTALYLEAVYVLEVLAPAALHADRFLPPTPLRVAADHRGRDATDVLAAAPLDRHAPPRAGQALLGRPDIRDVLLPRLLDRTRLLADTRVPGLIAHGQATMRAQLDAELARIRELRTINPSVRDEEITLLEEQRAALDAALQGARLRLDSVCLVYRGKAGSQG